MITEAEANKLGCPIVNIAAEIAREATALCVASRCMMWRWELIGGSVAAAPRRGTRGYCGLAGVPVAP